MSAAQAGDRRAFECLVIGCQSRMLRWLTRLTRDSVIAEELWQDTLVNAYVSLKSFRGEAAFTTWIARIAKNTFLAWHKMQQRQPEQNGLDDVSPALECSWCDWPSYSESPETLLWQQELSQTLQQAMADLPADLSQALKLREQDGLNYADIARIQHVPIGTVRSRIHRARKTLARTLKHQMEPK